ncbi:unnamed protein product [Allacma fusca]|uniref:Uncharacterized protein n=1 Tax=Allacma fusca TaxID=39272 RepID=A0A8J2P958_9HEXA|nr:unnamed protein product [Allacma fusca]
MPSNLRNNFLSSRAPRETLKALFFGLIAVFRDNCAKMALDLNESEFEALELFKDTLGEYIKDELDSYQRHDANLLRWLRARDLNVDKAEKMLKASMIWRKNNDVDKILSWRKPQFFSNGFNFMAPGVDKDGCILCIVPFGKWDLRGAVEAGHRADVVRFANQILEQGFQFMKKESNDKKILNQFIIIFDWTGFSLNQILSRETVDTMMECLRLFEANYPETLKEAYVVNAPAIFEIVYNLLKPFVSARTLAKLKVYSTNPEQWRGALLKNIDPFELPSQYGGSNLTCKNYNLTQGLERPPRAHDLSKGSFQSATISAGDKLVIDQFVDLPGTHLTCNFTTRDYDIGFQILYNDELLFACQRADSHRHMQKGLVVCNKIGTYKFCFDNSFSKFRSKNISFAIEQDVPEKLDGSAGKIDQLG